ncbi:hypothetical protein ABTQ08_20345, partial [Acinetobacter baumannii]
RQFSPINRIPRHLGLLLDDDRPAGITPGRGGVHFGMQLMPHVLRLQGTKRRAHRQGAPQTVATR